MTITDARGRAVEKRQYQGPTPSGAYDSTLYVYNHTGQLASVTTPGGKVWRFGYDLRGRKTSWY
jgi:YD repeat-containing protein